MRLCGGFILSTSNTYATDFEIAEICDEAFERAGIDPETLTARHLRSARRSMNLIFSDWSNEGINLWQIEQETQTLTTSDGSYNTPTDTIGILEVFVRRDSVDIPVEPMTRDEYAGIPTKTTEGLPSRYYFDRLTPTPTLTLWPIPENSTDVLYYYRMRQSQDVGVASNTADVPYRWLEALTAEMAVRVAQKYNPERIGPLMGIARSAFKRAKIEDRQRAPTSIRVNYRR